MTNRFVRHPGILLAYALLLVGCVTSIVPTEKPVELTQTQAQEDLDSSEDEDTSAEEVMNITIVIVLSEGIAHELHKGAPLTVQSHKLMAMAEELGVVLEPLHPGTEDPSLVPYFEAQVMDMQAAERVIAQFQASDVVESVYIKPPEGPPDAPP